MFSFESLDVGSVYINAVYSYEVLMQNVGEIDAHFNLKEPEGDLQSRFTFEVDNVVLVNVVVVVNACLWQPSAGVIAADEVKKIKITFSSDTIGEFDETSYWKLQGSTSLMSLSFTGSVVAPKFNLDVNVIDFGRVSYGFLNSVKAVLHNHSDIAIKYRLRVPSDGKFYEREVNMMMMTTTTRLTTSM